MTAVAGKDVLIVWDFDHSLVDDNSDTWVVQALRPELLPEFKRLRVEEGLGWTEIMGRQMEALWKLGVKQEDIDRCMTALALQPRMVETVQLIQSSGATQMILSDANTHFIEAITAHHGIRGAFASVITNGSEYAPDGRLLVTPHHPAHAPHACALCPPNLCKGGVLDTIKGPYQRIIYVGDGGGDFCPATRMSAGDLVLARHAEDRAYGLWHKLMKCEPGQVAAEARTWATGEDLYRIFAAELGMTQLDPV